MMINDNEPGTVRQPDRNDPGVENAEEPAKQAPGYNELQRGTNDSGGDTDQRDPSWRSGSDPSIAPADGGMQSEGEPGRSERDSTGGVEGTHAAGHKSDS